MSDETFHEITTSDIEAGVHYALRKKMTPSTITKLRSGRADKEALLQTLAEYRISLQGTDEAQQADGVDRISVADVIAAKDAEIAKLLGIIEDHTKANMDSAKINNELSAKVYKYRGALFLINQLAKGLWFGRGQAIEQETENALFESKS